jgi:uncharacterized protein (DUF1919 family)
MPDEKDVRKIQEVTMTTTEYTEERIEEAIINLTRQIDSLEEERDTWIRRKERLNAENP